MKKMFFPLIAVALVTSVSSCAKCYVCRDKTSTTFEKVEYCDKDFDKGDIDAEIKSMEADGWTCHATSKAL